MCNVLEFSFVELIKAQLIAAFIWIVENKQTQIHLWNAIGNLLKIIR